MNDKDANGSRQYGGQISFMGGFDGADFDSPDWTPEGVRQMTWDILEQNEPSGFIPCIAQGGPGSVFPGVYASMCEEIDKYSIEKFGVTQEGLDQNRLPWQILF